MNSSKKACLYVAMVAAVFMLAAGVGLPQAMATPPSESSLGTVPPCGKARAITEQIVADRLREQDEYGTIDFGGDREAMTDTDVLHAAVEIEVLPGSSPNLIGTTTLTIQSKSAALSQFTFRLRSPTYTISSAVINGTTPITVTTGTNPTRTANLDRVYTMDEIFTLTFTYSGTAVSVGFGSINYTTHSGSNIVYTLSEPYYAYSWWPCKDGNVQTAGDNSDKFTLAMSVIAPSTMVSASNGLLDGIDTLTGSRKRYRWSTDYPLSTYLVCFSTTNYNTWTLNYTTLTGGTMPVYFYIYPEDDNASNRNAWGQTVQMLATYAALFGEYPFVNEKYGIYECEFGGGMEHQTFTAQGTFDEGVTCHELSHQWWGDMITCKTWNHIWLNEGFATYAQGLWEEFQPGSTGLPALKAYMATIKYTAAGSVYVTDSEVTDPNAIFDSNTTYNKGGWVVHMLRHVLGDTDFFQALADYRAAYAFQAATTENLQAVCEALYGSSLTWFFQEWVYGERAPAYATGWSSVNVNGQNYLLVYIDQTQSASYQRFTMPLDVRVNGATTYVVYNDSDPEWFVIPIPSTATTVQLDPDAWVLWSGNTSTSYVAGPPKIVATSPAPGTVLSAPASTDHVNVTFHTNVSTAAGQYTLTGATHGAIPVTFAYNSGTYTTTLTAAANLPADTYTLTVSDALTAVNSGQRLDGEIADPLSPASLPSGNGVQLGSATIQFTVTSALGDLNCDGAVNNQDIDAFVVALFDPAGYAAQYPSCNILNGDFTGDGFVNNRDIDGFIAALFGEQVRLDALWRAVSFTEISEAGYA